MCMNCYQFFLEAIHQEAPRSDEDDQKAYEDFVQVTTLEPSAQLPPWKARKLSDVPPPTNAYGAPTSLHRRCKYYFAPCLVCVSPPRWTSVQLAEGQVEPMCKNCYQFFVEAIHFGGPIHLAAVTPTASTDVPVAAASSSTASAEDFEFPRPKFAAKANPHLQITRAQRDFQVRWRLRDAEVAEQRGFIEDAQGLRLGALIRSTRTCVDEPAEDVD